MFLVVFFSRTIARDDFHSLLTKATDEGPGGVSATKSSRTDARWLEDLAQKAAPTEVRALCETCQSVDIVVTRATKERQDRGLLCHAALANNRLFLQTLENLRLLMYNLLMSVV